MAHDVFISYSKGDKAVADAAAAMLEQHGVRAWIAPRDIRPGADWGESIIDAISSARMMVLILSVRSNESPQVRREVQSAFERGVTVIPFRVEEVAPARALEYYLGSVHWLDAMSPPLEAHLGRLVETAQSVLRGTEATEPSTPPATPRVRPPAPRAPGAPSAAPRAATPAPHAPSTLRERLPRYAVIAGVALLLVAGATYAIVRRDTETALPASSSPAAQRAAEREQPRSSRVDDRPAPAPAAPAPAPSAPAPPTPAPARSAPPPPAAAPSPPATPATAPPATPRETAKPPAKPTPRPQVATRPSQPPEPEAPPIITKPLGRIEKPRLTNAWFDERPRWNPEKGVFENTMWVQFEPTAGPLWLTVKVRYEADGIKEREIENAQVDVSSSAGRGNVWRRRVYRDPGEYHFKVTLRNSLGEASRDLPTQVAK